MILGENAAEALLNDEAVLKKLDTKNLDAGKIELNGAEVGGYTYYGKYMGKHIYEYVGTYDDGTEKNFIDANTMIMTSRKGLWELHFALINDFKAITGNMIQKFFSKFFDDEKSGKRNILVESDSTPVCLDVDCIFCAKVLPDA
jgi:hypothetical protein